MICNIIGGYMLAKTLVVFYVWSPDIFFTYFYHNPFSGIVYSIMSNKTLPYHTQMLFARKWVMPLAVIVIVFYNVQA